MDIRLPNGTIIRGVPEGVSRAALQEKLIASGRATPDDFQASKPAGALEPEAPQAVDADGFTPEMRDLFARQRGEIGETRRGFARGARDPVDAAAQVLEKTMPATATSAINAANNWLVDMGLPLKRLGDEGLQGQLNEQEAEYQAMRADEGETGTDWDRLGGNLLSPAALVPAAAAARAIAPATRTGRMATGAGIGAGEAGLLSAPLTGGAEADFATEKLKQAGLGAVLGGGLSGLGGTAIHAGAQARRPEVARLRAAGVEPTVGQTVGGGVNRLEEAIGSMPLVGDVVAGARLRAAEEFNRGAINEVLAPLGARVDDAGQQGIGQMHEAVSKAYRAAADMVDRVPVDATVRREINDVRKLMEGLPEPDANAFDRFISKNLNRRVGDSGDLTPEAFKQLDSDIGQLVDANPGPAGDAYRRVQDALRDAAGRESPEYREALRVADSAFARKVRVDDASNRAMNRQDNLFTPGQLNMAVRKADPSARKSATARGGALMQDYANAGQQVLGDRLPDSGTARRLMSGGLLSPGAYGAAGGAMVGELAGGLGLGLLGAAGSGRVPQAAMTAALRRMPEGGDYGGLLGGLLGGELGSLLGEEL